MAKLRRVQQCVMNMDRDLTVAVVKVGGGRGFIVRAAYRSLVVTAAHCLPRFPPCHPVSYTHERTYSRLLGPLYDAKPAVWAECLFIDPLADIAVLGSPDGQVLYEEAEAYEALTDKRPALSIGPAPATGPGWVLTLAGRWSSCIVEHIGYDHPIALRGSLCIGDVKGGIHFGMSGSPILADDGTAIGVVSTDSMNPHLIHDLPGWLLRKLNAASLDAPTRRINRRHSLGCIRTAG